MSTGITRLLKFNLNLKEFKEYNSELIKLLRKIEPNLRDKYLTYVGKGILFLKVNLEIFKELVTLLEQIEINNKTHVSIPLIGGLISKMQEINLSVEIYKETTKQLKKIDQSLRIYYLNNVFVNILKKNPSLKELKEYNLKLLKSLEKIAPNKRMHYLLS